MVLRLNIDVPTCTEGKWTERLLTTFCGHIILPSWSLFSLRSRTLPFGGYQTLLHFIFIASSWMKSLKYVAYHLFSPGHRLSEKVSLPKPHMELLSEISAGPSADSPESQAFIEEIKSIVRKHVPYSSQFSTSCTAVYHRFCRQNGWFHRWYVWYTFDIFSSSHP